MSMRNFTPEYRDITPMAERIATFADIHTKDRRLRVHARARTTPPRPATKRDDHREKPPHPAVGRQSWSTFRRNGALPHRAALASTRRAPDDVPPEKKLTDAEIAKELGAFVDRLAAKDLFSGTVLVAKDGKPFFTKAVGIANRDFMAPFKLDTKFNTGSAYKMNHGSLDLPSSPRRESSRSTTRSEIPRHELARAADLDKVTIEQLLTHTRARELLQR